MLSLGCLVLNAWLVVLCSHALLAGGAERRPQLREGTLFADRVLNCVFLQHRLEQELSSAQNELDHQRTGRAEAERKFEMLQQGVSEREIELMVRACRKLICS